MKTFVLVALVACVAIIFVEIAQSDARRGDKCDSVTLEAREDVNCTRASRPKLRCCRRTCSRCYEEEELSTEKGCLVRVDRRRTKCVCLSATGEETTTTEAPESSTDNGEETSTTEDGAESSTTEEPTTTTAP